MNAPWKPAGVGSRDPFAAYVCDDTTVETIRPIATDLGWSIDKIFKGGLRNAIQSLSVSASPMILFVDLAESGDPLNDINALAEVCEPGTVVIAAGQVNDVRLYRDLVASGIQDYLLKPLHPDMLREAFGHAQTMLNAPKQTEAAVERPHGAIAVIGARGGVGASTISAALAWLMAERESRSTALLDLDIHFGTGALALDLEPGRGLTDAIENPSRIDGLFIERAMVRATEKLAVLSAEAPINTPLITDGTAFFQLQEEMRSAFECTIIDLPRGMLVQYPHLMTEVQAAIIVTELTLAAARDTIRLLSWLKTNAPRTTVTVVANRVHASGQLEISRKDFEGSIERKIDQVVPFDQKLLTQSAKLGKTVAEAGKNSKTIAPLLALARGLSHLSDEDDAALPTGATRKGDTAPKGKSLMSGFSSIIPKRAKK
ncbi:AAA family ATPase [Sphingomonas oligophenolica]|uniref:Pilus assembly protein CpaE n=1 Tax=Sphingomonas oligophenolica TaxID=301154 RepID=A0A502CLS6_9SPHN|nr:P-loop NTPase [Sphingomonas oligophenolica]TPG13510.1 pilus assembly protein CpaE [Sphingomonas oligophenolica]